jgi:uncharacterized protein (DUF2267 family)
MQHDEFIGQVQHRAHLDSRGAAERATRATLETLGERIPDGLAGNLAAQLPIEIGEHLTRTAPLAAGPTGERFDRQEFIRRVAKNETVDEPDAAYHARVVFEMVSEATTGGVVDKVYQSLPDDVSGLLRMGSRG